MHHENALVTIKVADMDRAIAFYVEKLGLTLMANYGGRWAEVQAPGLVIGLHPAEAGGASGASHLSIGFGIVAFDDAVAELRRNGVTVDVEQDGPYRLAHFSDPDGTPLYLAEAKKG